MTKYKLQWGLFGVLSLLSFVIRGTIYLANLPNDFAILCALLLSLGGLQLTAYLGGKLFHSWLKQSTKSSSRCSSEQCSCSPAPAPESALDTSESK